jgi:hypothetical protein
MDMSLRGWEKLSCECGGEHFQQVYTLSWHEGQGTSTRPDGWTCAKCGARTDSGKMINVAKAKVLKDKIAELQAQNA